MKTLPFRVTTATGDMFDFTFPLHPETVSPSRVNQIASAVLSLLDRDIGAAGETSNGDVLQALAMILAVRSRMIHAAPEITGTLARDLLATALGAVAEARRETPDSGRA